MVRVLEDTKKVDTVTSQLFLSSLKTWYPDSGVNVIVERVGKVYTTKFSKDPQIPVTLKTTEPMTKVRSRVLNDEGKPIMVYDVVMDKENPKIEIIENSSDIEVTFFFKMKYNPKSAEEEVDEFIINNKSNTFPLINYAFIRAGELNEGNDKSFACTYEEIELALSKLDFKACVETREYNNREYNCLIAEDCVVGDEVKKHKLDDNKSSTPSSKGASVTDEIPIELQKRLVKNNLLRDVIGQLTIENIPINRNSLIMELNFMQNDGVDAEAVGEAKDVLFNLL